MSPLLSEPPPGVSFFSIMLRFTDDTFDEHLQSTIGVDFKASTTFDFVNVLDSFQSSF